MAAGTAQPSLLRVARTSLSKRTCMSPAATATSTPRAQKIWLTASTTIAGHSRTQDMRGRDAYACIAATIWRRQQAHESRAACHEHADVMPGRSQAWCWRRRRRRRTCARTLIFMRRSTSPSHTSTLPAGAIGLSNGT